MTFLSCVAIGVAFVLAVGLLVFAAVVLGWYVPALIERVRRRRGSPPGSSRSGGSHGPSPPGVWAGRGTFSGAPFFSNLL